MLFHEDLSFSIGSKIVIFFPSLPVLALNVPTLEGSGVALAIKRKQA